MLAMAQYEIAARLEVAPCATVAGSDGDNHRRRHSNDSNNDVGGGGDVDGAAVSSVQLYGNNRPALRDDFVGERVVVPSAAGFKHRVYDPKMYNTAVCASAITLADGANGKLYYRGYDMETLVARGASFEEVAFLLINGELPDGGALARWRALVMSHTFLHEDILSQLRTFRYDAHPMGSLISAVSALSTFHPEANPALRGASLYRDDGYARNKQIYRILGKVATVAACAWRVRIGRPFVSPDSCGSDSVGYVENFLHLLDGCAPNALLASVVERAWIALADDGMNCATGALRHVASSGPDPYVCIASAMAATYGDRISGVGDAVVRMLGELLRDGSDRDVRAYVERCKRGGVRLQGFGHVNYKKYDPRARIVRQLCDEAEAAVEVREPLLAVAKELEVCVLADAYFAARGVYPNVDLYLPLLLRIIGLPADFYPVFVAIPRTVGWVSHWLEGLDDPAMRIYRPRQIYEGEAMRDYVPLDKRDVEHAPGVMRRMVRSVSLYRRRSKLDDEQEDDEQGGEEQ